MATYTFWDNESFEIFMKLFLGVILGLAISIPIADEEDSENIGIATAVLAGIFVLLFILKALNVIVPDKPLEDKPSDFSVQNRF